MARTKRDLFEDSTMSFGEHLEELRERLLKAIYGIVIGSVIGLFYGGEILDFVRAPLDRALRQYQFEATGPTETRDVGDWLYDQLGLGGMQAIAGEETTAADPPAETSPGGPEKTYVDAEIDLSFLRHAIDPERFPKIADDAEPEFLTLRLYADELGRFRAAADQVAKPVTLGVQEAFLMYVKVSLFAGVLLSSPWLLWQAWLFVGAGMYPHERAYVRKYGWLAGLLFFVGLVFCYYIVLPFVLHFLVGFNTLAGSTPQIQLSQWIGFVTILPLVFGVSFQLPIVMLAMERVGVFEVDDYREKWRIAVLVIAVVSMLVTPTDPTSMMAMMLPLCLLYWVGIKLCDWTPGDGPAAATA